MAARFISMDNILRAAYPILVILREFQKWGIFEAGMLKFELTHISHKQSEKSVKMLPQIFGNCCEDIISSDKASSSFRKDGITDCAEFSSVCEKCGLSKADAEGALYLKTRQARGKFKDEHASDEKTNF